MLSNHDIGLVTQSFIHLPDKYIDADLLWKPGRCLDELTIKANIFTGPFHTDQFRFVATAKYFRNQLGGVSFQVYFQVKHRVLAFDMGPLENHLDKRTGQLYRCPHWHIWDPLVGELGFQKETGVMPFEDPVEGWLEVLNRFLTSCGIRNVTPDLWSPPRFQTIMRAG